MRNSKYHQHACGVASMLWCMHATMHMYHAYNAYDQYLLHNDAHAALWKTHRLLLKDDTFMYTMQALCASMLYMRVCGALMIYTNAGMVHMY